MGTAFERAFSGVAAALLGAYLALAPALHAAEGTGPKGEAPPPFQGQLKMRDTGTGEDKPIMMLGGEVGVQAVNGVVSRLYVLQADSAERFSTPGAPTHIFTLSLIRETDGGILDDAAVTLRITGPGEEVKVSLKEYKERFYQGRARLAAAGAYRIEARFSGKGESGVARYTFDVKPPAGIPRDR